MSRFDFVDTDSGETFDIIAEVGFENPLEAKDTLQVLHIILETLTSNVASTLFEQLASLELDQTSLKMRFRFATREGNPSSSGGKTGEETSRLKAQFIFYLFAKIDQQYKLGDVPFPPNFRAFLSLPDYIQ